MNCLTREATVEISVVQHSLQELAVAAVLKIANNLARPHAMGKYVPTSTVIWMKFLMQTGDLEMNVAGTFEEVVAQLKRIKHWRYCKSACE